MSKRFTYPLLFFFVFSLALGQTPLNKIRHSKFTEQDGLDVDNILCMQMDNDGFLWVGGKSLDNRLIVADKSSISLQRFNGRTFHSVELPKLTPPIRSIDQIIKRNDGKFYITNSNHVLLFDPITQHFQEVKITGSSVTKNQQSLIFDYDNKKYILSKIGQNNILNQLHDNLEVTPIFNFLITDDVLNVNKYSKFIAYDDFCIISDDNLQILFLDWEGTILKKQGLSLAERQQTKGRKKPKFFIDESFLRNDTVFTFMRGDKQLHYIDEKKREILPYKNVSSEKYKSNIKTSRDTLGRYMLGYSKDEMLEIDGVSSEGKVIQKLKNQLFEKDTPIKLFSNNLDEDIWIGTYNRTLHHIRFPSEKIKVFLEENEIRTITSIEKDLYIVATERNNWFQIDLSTNTVSPMNITFEGVPMKINATRNIIIDEEYYWSHTGGNIARIHRESLEAELYRHYPVMKMLEATDSTFIYATNGYNLMEFNKNSKKHRPLAVTDTLRVYDIVLHDEVILGATDKGAFTYNVISKETNFYDAPAGVADSFMLMTTYSEESGFLLGSRSGKIINFDPKDKSFSIVYEDPLDAGIATILFENNTWWISTFNGVVAYNLEDGSSIRFSEEDGLSNNEMNRYSAYNTGDGLLLGSIKGLNYFNPNDLKVAESKSELVLLKLRSYSAQEKKVTNVYDRSKLNNNSTIVLPAEYKELQLDFALTHSSEDKRHRYQYRLNNEDWIDLQEEQSIRFPNLAAGNYVLELEALDFSGKKIGNSLLLQIDSKSFFYKTWWFYLIVSLVAVVLLFYFLKQAQLKQKLQEKFSEDLLISQENERTRIAKDLHDSVGQQLTLIKKKAQNLEQDDLSTMTNNALEEVRHISRGLYPVVLEQLGLSESVLQLIDELDEQTNLFFSSEIDNIDKHFTKKETVIFYRFIQESLTNILKHAEATSVSVIIKKRGRKIYTTISDNGKGFDLNEKSINQSLGLKTLNERIRILNGQLTINSNSKKGTEIISEIPTNS